MFWWFIAFQEEMAFYEAKNGTYYLQKNEIPKNFDPIFRGKVPV